MTPKLTSLFANRYNQTIPSAAPPSIFHPRRHWRGLNITANDETGPQLPINYRTSLCAEAQKPITHRGKISAINSAESAVPLYPPQHHGRKITGPSHATLIFPLLRAAAATKSSTTRSAFHPFRHAELRKIGLATMRATLAPKTQSEGCRDGGETSDDSGSAGVPRGPTEPNAHKSRPASPPAT